MKFISNCQLLFASVFANHWYEGGAIETRNPQIAVLFALRWHDPKPSMFLRSQEQQVHNLSWEGAADSAGSGDCWEEALWCAGDILWVLRPIFLISDSDKAVKDCLGGSLCLKGQNSNRCGNQTHDLPVPRKRGLTFVLESQQDGKGCQWWQKHWGASFLPVLAACPLLQRASGPLAGAPCAVHPNQHKGAKILDDKKGRVA